MIKLEKKPVTEKPKNDGFLPLPADVRDEFEQDRGPCFPGKFYVPVQTNQLGEIQIHPCTCGSVFPYSTIYGWLYVRPGSPLKARIAEIAKQLTGNS